jgi:LuxR family maltose regulon positive regulatory protein
MMSQLSEAMLLSRREHDVLRLLVRGMSNSEIAQTLTITVNTVKMHIKNIYAKLGVRNRAQVIIRAQQLYSELGEVVVAKR